MRLEALSHAAGQFAGRVRYPAHGDGYSCYRNVTAPSLYLGLVMLYTFMADSIATQYNLMPPKTGEAIASVTSFLFSITSNCALLGALPMTYVALRERHNRICFGESLTVSRVAILPNTPLVRKLPELEDEKYYGELHFIGKKLDCQVKQDPNSFGVMRDGIRGLHQLAQACAQQRAELGGINYFIGQSWVVTERLAKYGFRVTDPLPAKEYLVKDPAAFLRKSMGADFFSWLTHRPFLMCVGRREDLVTSMIKNSPHG